MTRKITGGRAGSPFVGAINVDPTAIMTAANNQDITIAPQGTAVLSVTNNLEMENQTVIRFADADSSNWVGFRAPATVTSNVTWTLPAADGSNTQILQTNGSGSLQWASFPASASITDPGATSTVHYLFFATNAGALPTGNLTGINVRSNLAFTPSTGELTAAAGNFATVYGATTASAQLTIRGTSNATKATASILMPDGVAASNTTTGTLVVTGGVGVSGTVHAGNFTTSGTLSAGTITETSSITLKENVKPIENALDKILQLAGVIYDRKDGSSYNEAGLIAEQVNEILPDLVTKDEKGNPLGVKYTKLTAYLIESIKEIKQEIANLKG